MRALCRRFGAQCLAVALSVTMLAGCGTATDGAGQSTPTAALTKVELAQLNTGDYPDEPLAPLGAAGAEDAGRRVEAQRMAPFVVGPWQVDPALVEGASPAGAVVVKNDEIGFFVWPFMAAGTADLPLVAGFVADRHSADKTAPTALRNGVLRFADDAAAAAAVERITFWTTTIPPGKNMMPTLTEPVRVMPIPGRPSSSGLVLTFSDGGATVQELTVLTAHGPYLLLQVVRSPKGPDDAAVIAGRTLDQQLPLIDGFAPTDPGALAALPLDPTGLVARTLPLPPVEATPMSGAAYPPAGALHAADDPLVTAPVWSGTGVDEVSFGLATVYQAKDADGATALAQKLGDAAAEQPSSQVTAAVPGLPQSRCTRVSDAAGLVPKYLCLAAFDRYVLKSLARDFARAQQQLAAQYRMLAG